MKKLHVGILLGVLVLWSAPSMAAPLLYANFCPGDASCPSGVTLASISISGWDVTDDVNDYLVEILFAGNAGAPKYLDEFSFTIGGVKTPEGYEAKPTLLFPPPMSGWQVYYDNISASPGSCSSDTNNANEVCAQSLGSFGAVLPGNTVHFSFYADLAGSLTVGEDTPVNLRAQFLDSRGKNAGILSPDFNPVAVPEPGSLSLLGIGMLLAGSRLRRKKRT